LELVQAKHVRLVRKVLCDRHERITCTGSLGSMHPLMNIKHEWVEVDSAFVGDVHGEGIVE